MKFRLNLAVLVASAVLLPLAGAGCAESELATTPEEQDIQADPRVAEDAVVLTDVPVVLLPDLPGDQGVDPPEDVPPIDDDEWGECLEGGEPGCPCTGNEDCNSGWCVPGPDGDLCSAPCDGDCPEGWSGEQVSAEGRAPTFICVALHTQLCRPCITGTDCESLGGGGGFCLEDPSGLGSFCGSSCDDDVLCPEDFECQEVWLGQAGTVSQCVPVDGAECTCNAQAISDQASTSCLITNDAGTCPGVRSCSEDGLGACEGPEPAPELCGGEDEDCDDIVDEGFEDVGTTCDGADDDLCAYGVWACSQDGQGLECTNEAIVDIPEICDGQDNDCDGDTD